MVMYQAVKASCARTFLPKKASTLTSDKAGKGRNENSPDNPAHRKKNRHADAPRSLVTGTNYRSLLLASVARLQPQSEEPFPDKTAMLGSSTFSLSLSAIVKPRKSHIKSYS